MNLAEKLNNKFLSVRDAQIEVVDEIVNYFKQKINSPKWIEYIEQQCSEEDTLKNRQREWRLEFWIDPHCCSETYFRAPGVYWSNPENPRGIKSETYKGVRLYDIQNEVGAQILTLVINKFRELGFHVNYYDNESWLKYYAKKVVISW